MSHIRHEQEEYDAWSSSVQLASNEKAPADFRLAAQVAASAYEARQRIEQGSEKHSRLPQIQSDKRAHAWVAMFRQAKESRFATALLDAAEELDEMRRSEFTDDDGERRSLPDEQQNALAIISAALVVLSGVDTHEGTETQQSAFVAMRKGTAKYSRPDGTTYILPVDEGDTVRPFSSFQSQTGTVEKTTLVKGSADHLR